MLKKTSPPSLSSLIISVLGQSLLSALSLPHTITPSHYHTLTASQYYHTLTLSHPHSTITPSLYHALTLLHTHCHYQSFYHSHRHQFPSETVHTMKEHADEVLFVRFSHDGTQLASGAKDGQIIIWKIQVCLQQLEHYIIVLMKCIVTGPTLE